jgi:hypothetical protein
VEIKVDTYRGWQVKEFSLYLDILDRSAIVIKAWIIGDSRELCRGIVVREEALRT